MVIIMVVVGFNFTKINVEKKDNIKGKVNIANNVSIKSIEKADLSLGKAKQEGVKFIFEFTTDYEPDVASILLVGDVLFIDDEKKVKNILDEWKKTQKAPDEVMNQVLNTILSKCNVQALVLSRDVNLPSPIPLPKVELDKKK